jgi:hypothetical protein
VLLGSSTLFYFCAGGQVINLARHLAKRTYVTLEVDEEIRRNSRGQAEWRAASLRATAALPWAKSES